MAGLKSLGPLAGPVLAGQVLAGPALAGPQLSRVESRQKTHDDNLGVAGRGKINLIRPGLGGFIFLPDRKNRARRDLGRQTRAGFSTRSTLGGTLELLRERVKREEQAERRSDEVIQP